MWQRLILAAFIGLVLPCESGVAQDLTQGLTFYCNFDDTVDAAYAVGDGRAYTASSAGRQQVELGVAVDGLRLIDDGKFGGGLRFGPKTEKVLMYRGAENLPATGQPFDITVAMWMRLDPDRDLAPGFVDPLQITDKGWNNSSLFVDFTKDDRPRKFRLGVFSEYTFWNPQDTAWDAIEESARPMVTVDDPAFGADRWTHIAFVVSGVNRDQPADAKLYINGQLQGALGRAQRFQWDPTRLAIMVGIYYTGDMDELAIWQRALNSEELLQLQKRAVK